VPSGTGCSWAAGPPAFGAPQSLGAPNTADPESDPTLSHDGLTLYYVGFRTHATDNDIYVATRPSVTAPFGAGTLLSAANSKLIETHFVVSSNGLESFVVSDRSGTTGQADLWTSTRATTAAAWGTFVNLTVVNSSQGDYDPHLTADRLTLWFAPVNRAGGAGNQDLFYAVRATPSSPFGAPVAASTVNSPSNEWDVSLTDDALTIVFASDRDGAPHVYYARRPNASSSFGAPAIVTALDPYASTLVDSWISPDGCNIYFAANLPGGVGETDLYVVKAP
jgi:Tol biopolymer transport system component